MEDARMWEPILLIDFQKYVHACMNVHTCTHTHNTGMYPPEWC